MGTFDTLKPYIQDIYQIAKNHINYLAKTIVYSYAWGKNKQTKYSSPVNSIVF